MAAMDIYPLYKCLVKLKVDLIARHILREKPRILMYHGTIDDNLGIDCWWLIKESKFRKQIEFLSKYYRFISLDETLSNNTVPENACVLTFDDGYKSIFNRVYPILKRKAIPFTVYVTTGPVEEKSMIWTDQVFLFLQGKRFEEVSHMVPSKETLRGLDGRELQVTFLNQLKKMPYREKNAWVAEYLKYNGDASIRNRAEHPFEMLSINEINALSQDPLVTIGAHTVNHEILTKMPLIEAVEEISRSRQSLEKWTGQKIIHFSYPNGNYNAVLADKVKELGFKSAVRIGLGVNWTIKPFEIHRVGTDPADDEFVFQSMVNGLIPLKVELQNLVQKLKSLTQ